MEPTMLVMNDRQEFISRTVTELMGYFDQLVVIDLAEEDRTCPCCHCQYMAIREGEDVPFELPIKTKCGHILGYDCMRKWLPNNTCPMCRKPLFVVPGLLESQGEGEQVSDTTEYPEEEEEEEEEEVSVTAEEQAMPPPFNTSVEAHTANALFQSWPRNREWLVSEIRRVGAFREARLYSDLVAQGAQLPGPRTFGPDLHGLLDWRQDRSLCHEISRRGGFEYRGMGYDVWSTNWRVVEEKYEDLRNQGLCWDLSEAWIRHDGTIVYNSEGSGSEQSGPEPSPRVIDSQTSEEEINAYLERLGASVIMHPEDPYRQYRLEEEGDREDERAREQASGSSQQEFYDAHDDHGAISSDRHGQDIEMSNTGHGNAPQERADHVSVGEQQVEVVEGPGEAEDLMDFHREPEVYTLPSRNAQDYELDAQNTPRRFPWRDYLHTIERPSEALARRSMQERFNALARSVGTWEI